MGSLDTSRSLTFLNQIICGSWEWGFPSPILRDSTYVQDVTEVPDSRSTGVSIDGTCVRRESVETRRKDSGMGTKNPIGRFTSEESPRRNPLWIWFYRGLSYLKYRIICIGLVISRRHHSARPTSLHFSFGSGLPTHPVSGLSLTSTPYLLYGPSTVSETIPGLHPFPTVHGPWLPFCKYRNDSVGYSVSYRFRELVVFRSGVHWSLNTSPRSFFTYKNNNLLLRLKRRSCFIGHL